LSNIFSTFFDGNRLRKLRASKEETQLTGKEYSEQLRQQFEKLNRGKSEWAISALRNIQQNTIGTKITRLKPAPSLQLKKLF
jgi:regulation of enolase protein 1 (concanavalin A-like superfamily)